MLGVNDGKKRNKKLTTFRDIVKHCMSCSSVLVLKCTRDINRKNFCSRSCRTRYYIANGIIPMVPHPRGEKHPGWKGGIAKVYRECSVCGVKITCNSVHGICRTCFNHRKRKANEEYPSVICSNCGKEHHKRGLEIERNKTGIFFCSNRCHRLYITINTKKKKFVCTNCDKEKLQFPSQVHGDKFFCSVSCRSEYYGRTNRRALPFYIDGRTPLRTLLKNCSKYDTWRNAVFERDKWMCSRCGDKDYKHAHHIKNFSEIFNEFLSLNNNLSPEMDKELLFTIGLTHFPFWDIDNGISLCPDCHQMEHPDLRLTLKGEYGVTANP